MAVPITAGELLMTDIDARLREDVHLLGELLGNTIRDQYGEASSTRSSRSARAPRPIAVARWTPS
jgi:hypothetical protein